MKRVYTIKIFKKSENHPDILQVIKKVEYNYPEEFYTTVEFTAELQRDARNFLFSQIRLDISREDVPVDGDLFVCKAHEECEFAITDRCHLAACKPHKYGPKRYHPSVYDWLSACDMFWCAQTQKMMKCVRYDDRNDINKALDDFIEEI